MSRFGGKKWEFRARRRERHYFHKGTKVRTEGSGLGTFAAENAGCGKRWGL